MSPTPRDGGPVIDPEDPTGPGAQLREARHRANLSLEEVATQLRLDRRTVRALEENEFQYLPAPTFIRGYIRSYARLLGLPSGPILEAYDYQGFTPPDLLADITQRPQARFSDFPVRLATFLVAAGLVAMVVMWWHSRESAPERPAEVEFVADAEPGIADRSLKATPETTRSAEQPPEPPAPPAEELIAAQSAPESLPDAGSESSPSGVSAGPEPSTASSGPEETVVNRSSPAGGAASPADEPLTTAPDSAADAAADSAPGDTVTVREALITASEGPPSSPGRLVIRFSEKSWVEVFDADGVRREFRLATEGSRTNVSGTPPFNVLLGYAEGASVTFDGKYYDISPFIRGNTARFLIGPDGLAKARPPEHRSPPDDGGVDGAPEPSNTAAEVDPEPSPLSSGAAVSQPPFAADIPGSN